jgi:hypothetical protein
MKLSSVQGENASNAVSQLCRATTALGIVQKVPHDLGGRLLDVFQTSFVADYNTNLRVIFIQQRTLPMEYGADEILNCVESLYSDILAKGGWTGAGSTCMGQGDIMCWYCGERGHRACDPACKKVNKLTESPANPVNPVSKCKLNAHRVATLRKNSLNGVPTIGIHNIIVGGARTRPTPIMLP